MRDFTRATFKRLLVSLVAGGYQIVTYRDYMIGATSGKRIAILRHDVDNRPDYALEMARIEHQLGITTSYYFRDREGIFKPEILIAIENMGHEIGYHYENLSKQHGNELQALHDFQLSLAKFRKFVSIETICSHGRPISPFDNLTLWKERGYRELNILADINIDTDFTQILYLTDTGRSWNSIYNRRDKVKSSLKSDIRTTAQLISCLKSKSLPSVIFLNIHPQRWTDNVVVGLVDSLSQRVKNRIKYLFFIKRK